MENGWLARADKSLFHIINKQLSWPPLDNIMLLLRQPLTWIPAYFFFILFFYTNTRKYFLPIILLSLLTVSLTDFTSASILKPLIHRLRPCYDASLGFEVNNPAGCGGLFSMPSSHASNHFGISTFWFLVIRHTLNRSWYILLIWAAAVCYAQIYVGVHFPGDILAGTLLGVLTANCTFYFFKKWMPSFEQSAIINSNS